MKTKRNPDNAPLPISVVALPAGIKTSDLKMKYGDKDGLAFSGADYQNNMFELWHTTGMGWVIPTLLIRRAGARSPGRADRTYAVRVEDGAPCRVGLGPHVNARHTVYVRKSRVADLQRYLDLRAKGAEQSNNIRDRISSRRAQGALYRMNRGW